MAFTSRRSSAGIPSGRRECFGVSTCRLLGHCPKYQNKHTVSPRYQAPAHEELAPGLSLSDSVERLVVSPVFRAVPWDVERLRQQEAKRQASLLLISESDVCRSVLAAACLRQLLQEAGLVEEVEVATCGTRPYNVGEGAEPAAVTAAGFLGWQLPDGHTARLFDPAADIVGYDLLLVVDKYTAGDVMREVSSFDLINRNSQFSYKVRRLGEFRTGPHAAALPEHAASHPVAAAATAAAAVQGGVDEELDIEDPLYGNVGGEAEEQAVLRAAQAIQHACRGLVAFLQDVKEEDSAARDGVGVGLGPALRSRVLSMGPTAWLAPPMLSPRVDLEEVHGR